MPWTIQRDGGELINPPNRSQAARRFFNGKVRDDWNKCEAFPGNPVAGMFHFQPRKFFKMPPSAPAVPHAGFGGA